MSSDMNKYPGAKPGNAQTIEENRACSGAKIVKAIRGGYNPQASPQDAVANWWATHPAFKARPRGNAPQKAQHRNLSRTTSNPVPAQSRDPNNNKRNKSTTLRKSMDCSILSWVEMEPMHVMCKQKAKDDNGV
ncbi:uncharacterized protein [Diadema setosum]|uniref:uncharacterized protein n=1 Tax=Diadema setosum TaxID=31175 RepID=UPI003B3B6D74